MPKEKCENCCGRGYVLTGTSTSACERCKGNGTINSNMMSNYFG